MKKINYILIFILLVCGYSAQAVSLPTFNSSQDLGVFMQDVYAFSITIVGLLILIQFLRAGFLYLTAGGSGGKTSEAKSMMRGAIIGALILFSAFLILYVINPDLVTNTFNFDLGLKNSSQTQDYSQTDTDSSTTDDGSLDGSSDGDGGNDPGQGNQSGSNPLNMNPTIPLPNGLLVVQKVASEFPNYLANSCQTSGGTWEFMDEVVKRLHETDARFGYNGKRGNPNDLSKDAISYYFGSGSPTHGSVEVYVIDVIYSHCGSDAAPAWTDVSEDGWQNGVTGAYVYPRT